MLRSVRAKPYVIALLVVSGSTLGRMALNPLLHDKSPLLLFACGTVIAALYGGFAAGVACTLLTIPVADYLFVEPRYTWFLHDARADSITLLLFFGLGVGTSFIIDAFRQTRERLRKAN